MDQSEWGPQMKLVWTRSVLAMLCWVYQKRFIGYVRKLNLGDLDQCRAISSGARPFINYVRAIPSCVHKLWCETVWSLGFNPSEKCDKGSTLICLYFIRAKYGMDKSNAVIICSGKKVVPLVPETANIVISFSGQQWL